MIKLMPTRTEFLQPRSDSMVTPPEASVIQVVRLWKAEILKLSLVVLVIENNIEQFLSSHHYIEV